MGNIIPISSKIISIIPINKKDTRETNQISIICLDRMEKGLIDNNNNLEFNCLNCNLRTHYICPKQWQYDKQTSQCAQCRNINLNDFTSIVIN
jgi:hypothetical protein